MERVSYFEAAVLANILQKTNQEIFVVKFGLGDQNGEHFDCPGMKLNPRQQNLLKISKFRSALVDTINQTINSLMSTQSFSPIYPEENHETIFALNKDMENRKTFLESEVKTLSEELTWMKNPARKSLFRIELDDTLKMEQIRSINKINYFTKFYNEKHKNYCRKLAKQERLLHAEIQVAK